MNQKHLPETDGVVEVEVAWRWSRDIEEDDGWKGGEGAFPPGPTTETRLVAAG
jgi:hypothetical protein